MNIFQLYLTVVTAVRHDVTTLFCETRAEKRWLVGGVSRQVDRGLTDAGTL